MQPGTIQSEKPEKRMSKDDYYLGIAKAVAARSTCLRKRFGAIIVKEDAIVSTGYTGAARGVVNCVEVGCLRNEVGAAEYTDYGSNCISVHAEENAIINAARQGSSVFGGTLFIHGEFVGQPYGQHRGIGNLTEAKPCDRCKRAIINSGIKLVIMRTADGGIRKVDPSEWVCEDSENYRRRLADARKGA
jgi:dCMP deaminase